MQQEEQREGVRFRAVRSNTREVGWFRYECIDARAMCLPFELIQIVCIGSGDEFSGIWNDVILMISVRVRQKARV